MATSITRAEWQAKAESLSIRTRAFIDGKYVDAASGKTFACISPIDGVCRAQVAECDAFELADGALAVVAGKSIVAAWLPEDAGLGRRVTASRAATHPATWSSRAAIRPRRNDASPPPGAPSNRESGRKRRPCTGKKPCRNSPA